MLRPTAMASMPANRYQPKLPSPMKASEPGSAGRARVGPKSSRRFLPMRAVPPSSA